MAKKTKEQQVLDTLETVTHEDLKQFICTVTAKDRLLRDKFLTTFALQAVDGDFARDLRQQIKSILKTFSDSYGMINWSAAGQVNAEVIGLLDLANKQFQENNIHNAFLITVIVLEEMTKVLEFCDDSNGEIGECILVSLSLLREIAESRLTEPQRKRVFNYCVKSFEENIFSGWDWHIEVLEIAAGLIQERADRDIVMKLLDSPADSEFYLEELQLIKYNLLLVESESVAEKFLQDNVNNPKLREAAINRAINDKELDKAENLAKFSINQDKGKYPGLVNKWYDFLLTIAELKNNKEKIVEYARYLLIENSYYLEKDYYQILKDSIPTENWFDYVNTLIADIEVKNRGLLDLDILSTIFIKEQRWDKLFVLVKKANHFGVIENFEKYLVDDYATELTDLYEAMIIDYLKESKARNHYRKACYYIRRISKLGEADKADVLIERLKNTYPKRKALLDELAELEREKNFRVVR